MKNQFYIPACHKYLEDEQHTLDVQRLFSLCISAYHSKYPESMPNKEDLLLFLQANNLIPPSYHIENVDTENTESCFNIITAYHCNSICQLCGYSPLYKNLLGEHESILLGYALTNREHLQLLLNTGLHSKHFRSVIPLSPKSQVPVLPLNRLAFEYLEKIVTSPDDMNHLAEKITATIKENNKNKLCAADIKVAKCYLENLDSSVYRTLNFETIEKILKDYFQLEPKPSEQNINPTASDSIYIGGFLDGPILDRSSIRSISQEHICKNKKNNSSEENEKISLKKEIAEVDLATEPVSLPKKEALVCISETKEFPEDCNTIVQWKLYQSDLEHLPSVNLETCSQRQYQQFLDLLLMTPLLPIEIGTLNEISKVFLCIQGKLYYFSTYNSMIIDDMIPFISKSKFRKLLCYEPYMLYSYLYQQHITFVDVFSIKIFTDSLHEFKKYNYHPLKLFEQLFFEENHVYPNNILFCMQNYQNFYHTFCNRYGIQKEYSEQMLLCRFIGYSFLRNKISTYSLPLFEKETSDGYVFTYSPEESLTAPFKVIQIRFSWNDISNFPVKDLLVGFSRTGLYYEYQIYLLSFDKNTITLALPNDNIPFICELMNTQAYSIGEQRTNLPTSVAVVHFT